MRKPWQWVRLRRVPVPHILANENNRGIWEQHMDYALDRSEQQVRDAIIATDKVPAALVELAEPKSNIPADLAFPTFRAAKELKLSPPQLAQELAARVRFADDALIGSVAAAG